MGDGQQGPASAGSASLLGGMDSIPGAQETTNRLFLKNGDRLSLSLCVYEYEYQFVGGGDLEA